MHAIASIAVSVRCFVYALTIRVQTGGQPSFSPVHARRIGKDMFGRKVPQVSVVRQDAQKRKRYTIRVSPLPSNCINYFVTRFTYLQDRSRTMYWLVTIGWFVVASNSCVLSYRASISILPLL